jgi:hypothetical protein
MSPTVHVNPIGRSVNSRAEIRLLPNDMMLFAPCDCDLFQCLVAEGKPGRLDAVTPKRVLEHPKRPSAVDGMQKI